VSDFDISMIHGSRLKGGGDISPCGIACMHVSSLVEGDTSEQTHCCWSGSHLDLFLKWLNKWSLGWKGEGDPL